MGRLFPRYPIRHTFPGRWARATPAATRPPVTLAMKLRRSITIRLGCHAPTSCRARELRPRRAALERAHVRRETPKLAIEKIKPQRARDRAERDVVPRNRRLIEKTHL